MQLPRIFVLRNPQIIDNIQESISLICVCSNIFDNYEFGEACIGIYDYQITGF